MTPEPGYPRHHARRSAQTQRPPSPSRALMLVSDSARESASRRLARAYTAGRIDGGELERRIESAVSARTRADLDALTHDLPRRHGRLVPVWQLPIFPLVLLVHITRTRIRRLRHRRLGH